MPISNKSYSQNQTEQQSDARMTERSPDPLDASSTCTSPDFLISSQTYGCDPIPTLTLTSGIPSSPWVRTFSEPLSNPSVKLPVLRATSPTNHLVETCSVGTTTK